MQGLAQYNDSPSPDAETHASSSRLAAVSIGTLLLMSFALISVSAPPLPTKRKASPERLRRRLIRSRTPASGDVPAGEKSQDALLDEDAELPPVPESASSTSARLTRPDTVTESDTLKRSRLGLTAEELFAGATRPASIPGLDSWGMPDEVDPVECSSQLKASTTISAISTHDDEVAQFLALKVDQNQHINTSLLASSTFHNPHIYSKLVEFVDLDERDSFFPRHGWLTRCGIEAEIQQNGPKRMSEEQKRMQEEARARQETGKRSEIVFQPGRNGRGKAVDRHTTGGGSGKVYERAKVRDKDGASRSERERDRERDRFRPDRPRDVGSSGKYSNTLGFGRRDKEGGWDERDMTKEKPRYRYY